MERIFVNGKTYTGECIFRDAKNKFFIYVINQVHDKYLVLRWDNGKAQDMVMTGLDKVYEIIQLITENADEEGVRKQINKGIENIKRQCYNKSLKTFDKQKFKERLTAFYDNHYPLFIFLGIRLPDLLQSEMKNL